jgi:hypothetical protein
MKLAVGPSVLSLLTQSLRVANYVRSVFTLSLAVVHLSYNRNTMLVRAAQCPLCGTVKVVVYSEHTVLAGSREIG